MSLNQLFMNIVCIKPLYVSYVASVCVTALATISYQHFFYFFISQLEGTTLDNRPSNTGIEDLYVHDYFKILSDNFCILTMDYAYMLHDTQNYYAYIELGNFHR